MPSKIDELAMKLSDLTLVVENQKREFDFHSKDHVYLEKRLEVAEKDYKEVKEELREISTNIAVLVARGDAVAFTNSNNINNNDKKREWVLKVFQFSIYFIMFLLAFPPAVQALLKILGGKL